VGNNYAIEVENLTVKYGDEVALEDINFKLEHPCFEKSD
jgi:ABC-type Mn2+/Zn2+ transport system ATPase subunit